MLRYRKISIVSSSSLEISPSLVPLKFASGQILALHMVAALAKGAAVKIELFHRNDTIIVFFLAAKRNKDNAKVALASSSS